MTWKVEEDILHHIDIKEQGKPNQFSLGKSLWIGSDVRETITRVLGFCDFPFVYNKHLGIEYTVYEIVGRCVHDRLLFVP